MDFHVSESGEEGVPPDLCMTVTPRLRRMRGTDDAPPRCIALTGEIGREVSCAIYARRPSPCRDFAPYAALGMGEPACDRARARHGLEPLRSGVSMRNSMLEC
ncbi:hypothetical protein FACS1894116_09680 [Betaproteobacteria bacterium]|nr:hypothetical protein FACS1894116_09680 [Betaproteobacteria bacterium]